MASNISAGTCSNFNINKEQQLLRRSYVVSFYNNQLNTFDCFELHNGIIKKTTPKIKLFQIDISTGYPRPKSHATNHIAPYQNTTIFFTQILPFSTLRVLDKYNETKKFQNIF